VAWLEPELDVGADAGLLSPLLEPELSELLELPEPVLPEPELDVPDVPEPDVLELPVPEVPEVPEPLDVDELPLVGEALLVAPGRTSATAPAATTLATPTVTVVVLIRPRPRRRAATACDTVSRCGLFMTSRFTCSAGKRLAGVSEPPMSEGLPVRSQPR